MRRFRLFFFIDPVRAELWDPSFILEWKEKYAVHVFVENAITKKKSKMWRRKDRPPFSYPYQEQSSAVGGGAASKN
jgi:hypothetical protein